MAGPFDVEDLISKLTPDEKISLLSGKDFWQTRDIPRLQIPSLRTSDGPNGIRGQRFFNGTPSSCLPCGTGLAASWDRSLLKRAGAMLGRECAAKGAHVWLGPTVNMLRSPLGGRGFESYSEDPFLSGALAAAIVAGVQSSAGVAACIKHFVCNDQEHERQAVNCVVSERALREIYLMPFMLAQRDAKPLCYMTSYNRLNGVHVSENARMMQDVLRGEWGFDGLIMSDWFGTYSAAESTNAGLDLEMPGPPRMRGPNLLVSMGNRKVSQHALNDRVRQLLRLANRVAPVGFRDDAPEEAVHDTPETRALLRELAVAGIVLLKNDNAVLPLDKTKSVAVMGPNAQLAAYAGGGSASLRPTYTTTPYEGIRQHASDVRYTLGAHGYKQLPALSRMSTREDGAPGMTCRFYNEPPEVAGRVCCDVVQTDLSDMLLVDYSHPDIRQDVWYMAMSGTITPAESGDYLFGCSVRGTAQVFVDGELVVDNATAQRQGATFMGAGTLEERGVKALEAGRTYAVVLQFGSSPTQKVRKVGATAMRGGGVRLGCAKVVDADEEIAKAVALAKEVEQVVICAGLTAEWESEGFDRSDMSLPGRTNDLIRAVSAANPRTVVLMQSGTPVEMPWAASDGLVPALVQSSYGGNEGGNAIGDVLFGAACPAGKLVYTIPKRLEDNPAFLNFGSENGRVLYGEDVYVGYRFYEKAKTAPLFPFGHGLSYTSFELGDFQVTQPQQTHDGDNTSRVQVTLSVRNAGKVAGAAVVQVYVSQQKPSINRPPKELKGFEKIHLEPASTGQVTVDIPLKYAASYWDEEADKWVMEAGTYDVLVGQSSVDVALAGNFTVEKTSWWLGL
ncbi:hypothetical protein PG985_007960 [Apiospora marii]|uniref:uncharacterized protein n=1 Tax=Apiospora marii TaxID=335849 RepID=UPI00313189E8